jgi:hypothetical protein
VWALPLYAIIYLVLSTILFSGFVIMPLWALKLYIQNRRTEKSLKGEIRKPREMVEAEMRDFTSVTPSWRRK